MPLVSKMDPKEASPAAVPFYNDPKKRALIFQILTLLGVGLLAFFLISNTLANLEQRGISTGFGLLLGAAGVAVVRNRIV